jgi:hypothetical protein
MTTLSARPRLVSAMTTEDRDGERPAEGARDGALTARVGAVVEDQYGSRPGGLGVRRLDREVAAAPLDQRDVAGGEVGEVGLLAAAVGRPGVDRGDVAGHLPGAGEGEGQVVGVMGVLTLVGGGLLQLGWGLFLEEVEGELLELWGEPRPLQLVGDIFRGNRVSREPGSTVTAVEVSNFLKIRLVSTNVVNLDEIGQRALSRRGLYGGRGDGRGGDRETGERRDGESAHDSSFLFCGD